MVKKIDGFVLCRDDWVLTLNELRSQRVQLMLQLEVVLAGIRRCECMVAGFPVVKNNSKEFI